MRKRERDGGIERERKREREEGGREREGEKKKRYHLTENLLIGSFDCAGIERSKDITVKNSDPGTSS